MQRTTFDAVERPPRRNWWSKCIDLPRKVDDWVAHIVREHNIEVDASTASGVREAERESGRMI